MKTTVRMEIEIPEGYELAEPMMRKVKYGELYLYSGVVAECTHDTTHDYPILKKKWKPEAGKLYMFSDKRSHLGTVNGVLDKFSVIGDGSKLYLNESGAAWKYCWPIPKEMIGE